MGFGGFCRVLRGFEWVGFLGGFWEGFGWVWVFGLEVRLAGVWLGGAKQMEWADV